MSSKQPGLQQKQLQQREAQTFCGRMDSPIGVLTVLASEGGLTEIRFPNKDVGVLPKNHQASYLVNKAIDQLRAYFDGHLKEFDLPLDPGGTEFQKAVWRELQKVDYGLTASYGEIANAVDNPKAARAVGMANGKNPIPIVVPCHRIIGSDGSLTGFAGGLDTKRWLLAHERESLSCVDRP